MNIYKKFLIDFKCFFSAFFEITKNEFKDKYKGTYLGYFWSLLNPAIAVITTTFIFSNLFNRNFFDFLLLIMSGMVPWLYFSNSVNHANASFQKNKSLITKIFIPKIFIPLSSVLVVTFDSLITFTFVVIIFGFIKGINISYLWIPFIWFMLIIFTSSVCMIFSLITIFFKDFQFIVSVLLQALFFLTPVIYEKDFLGEKAQMFISLNPLTFFIESLRNIIFYNNFLFNLEAVLFIFFTLIFFYFSLFIFSKFEKIIIFKV